MSEGVKTQVLILGEIVAKFEMPKQFIDDINNVTITHIHANMGSKFLLDYIKKILFLFWLHS